MTAGVNAQHLGTGRDADQINMIAILIGIACLDLAATHLDGPVMHRLDRRGHRPETDLLQRIIHGRAIGVFGCMADAEFHLAGKPVIEFHLAGDLRSAVQHGVDELMQTFVEDRVDVAVHQLCAKRFRHLTSLPLSSAVLDQIRQAAHDLLGAKRQ